MENNLDMEWMDLDDLIEMNDLFADDESEKALFKGSVIDGVETTDMADENNKAS